MSLAPNFSAAHDQLSSQWEATRRKLLLWTCCGIGQKFMNFLPVAKTIPGGQFYMLYFMLSIINLLVDYRRYLVNI